MQAYNKTELENYFLAEEAEKLYVKKFLSKERLEELKKKLNQLKFNNNILFRFLFFLLGIFLFSTVIGAFSVVLFSMGTERFEIMAFFYAIVAYVGLEILVKMKFFRHGLDDSFIIIAQIAFLIGVGIASESPFPVFVFMIILGLFFAIRFMHTISAVFAYIGLLGLFVFAILENDLLPKFYLSFFCFIIAVVVYLTAVYFRKNQNLYPYFKTLDVIRMLTLLLGYLAVNYLVVREIASELMDLDVSLESDIPFAVIFYCLTFLIPLVYFFFGIKRKDKIILYAGLITLVLGYSSIRYYYSILPLEYVMVIGGILLFGLAYFSIQILKNKTEGVTFKPDRDTNNSFLLNAQVLLTVANATTPPPANSSPMDFGGGGFSGGGAGEKF
ncbi:hypothetical protein ACFSX9_07130 [Flavobacterium ardleyense]|uniref:DUF2157 domain-containing protein n=1 Tax=Flavobacterium ardleyense TaxID=2038737 RepID=A0ABW5Z867_9FLAO